MADRFKSTGQNQNLYHLKKPHSKPAIITHGAGHGPPSISLRKKHKRLPASPESRGLLALLLSTTILLVLSGTTVIAAVTCFILFAPIFIITSPIWVPTGVVLFFAVAAVVSLCGLGLAAAAVLVVQLVIKGGDSTLLLNI